MLQEGKETVKKVQVFLPEKVLNSVKEEAKIRGTTVSGYIRMLVMERFPEK